MNDIKLIGDGIRSHLKKKRMELENIFRCHLSYEDQKKAERLKLALVRAEEDIRRAVLDDTVITFY